jgi:hypothetical protein
MSSLVEAQGNGAPTGIEGAHGVTGRAIPTNPAPLALVSSHAFLSSISDREHSEPSPQGGSRSFRLPP